MTDQGSYAGTNPKQEAAKQLEPVRHAFKRLEASAHTTFLATARSILQRHGHGATSLAASEFELSEFNTAGDGEYAGG